MDTHEDQINELLATYERSLNTSDADLAASCYVDDGVFMPTTLPTVVGPDMADGYRQIFSAIGLNVTFEVDEVVVTSDETAHAVWGRLRPRWPRLWDTGPGKAEASPDASGAVLPPSVALLSVLVDPRER